MSETRSLAGLTLKQAYHKPEDDIAEEFYLPCFARAKTYDRAVGFFGSSIYSLAWPSLRHFVSRKGTIRLICSPVLSDNDINAMNDGYSARADEQNGEAIRDEFRRLLSTPGTVKPAKVLAALVALNVVDIRIAWVGADAGAQSRRLFHDKLGIFTDAADNRVAFKGSMNETWPGLALDGNIESVDVYTSWAGLEELSRVTAEQEYFDRLWDGTFPGVTTKPLPHVATEELIAVADTEQWEGLVDEILVEIDAANALSPDPRRGRVPRPHQTAALNEWQARNRRGIFEHATGSGKTFTALCAINDSLDKNEVPLVLVPSDLLLRQWAEELRATFPTAALLICGGGHAEWREAGRLRTWTRPRRPEQRARIVLATMQTAASHEFIEHIYAGDHVFLVADEVHHLGAAQAQRILTIPSGPRLGLSATPERAGDPTGTKAILAYFEQIIPPPFTLYDAITSNALTPYAYHVHCIALDHEEQSRWDALTKEISRVYAQARQSDDADLHARVKRLLIKRARIVKAAKQKVAAAVSILTASYERGQRWIVYCDDQTQLGEVKDALRNSTCEHVLEYHTSMAGDAVRTLDFFTASGGVIVAIRCLDEGVNIPAVSHALILASSKNPREYIQRRGRVLRKAPGKALAHIHDVLVTPQFDPGAPPSTTILEGEIARAIEFGRHALNPGCVTDLERLAIEHHINWNALTGVGVEDDDTESES